MLSFTSCRFLGLACSYHTIRAIIFTLFFSLTISSGYGQKDSASTGFIKPAPVLRLQRVYAVTISEAIVGTGSLIALNELWYKSYPRSAFHFFNDGHEWLQVDKVGHCLTAYYLGSLGADLFGWSGIKPNKAACYGGILGFMYLNAIEVIDGFSTQWGFSTTDLVANATGAGLLVAQQLVWNEQRILLKYSYHSTTYAQYRPAILGSGLAQTWLKDYNGQTYWLSLNIASVLNGTNNFPKWLNIAVGYGAEGMLGAKQNPVVNESGQPYPYFNRYRKAYFSLDIDLKRIKTNSHLLKALFATFNFIKIPAPAIELNNRGLHGRLMYF